MGWCGIAAALAAAAGGCGGATEPGLRFESDRVDVGRMFAGPSVPISFPFANGPTEVRVDQVDTSCGCVAPELVVAGVVQSLPAVIPPGARGEVRARYRTEGYRDRKLTGLTVLGAGPGLPRVLSVDSILDAWLEIEPAKCDFGVVDGSAEHSAQVRVRGLGDFRITHLLAGSPDLLVEGIPSEAAGREQVLKLVLQPSREEGRHAAFLNLGSDAGYSVRLPVSFEVQGRIWTNPGRLIMVGEVAPGIPTVVGIEVDARVGDLETPRVEVTGMEGVRTEVRPLPEKSRYRIDLTLPNDLPVGSFSAQVLLHLPHRLDGQFEEVPRELKLLGVVRGRNPERP
jgi:hypothetical protein